MVDTGVLVSAFAFGGLPRQALKHLVRTANIYVSPLLLEEYRAVPGALLTGEKITSIQWRTLVAGIASFVAGAKVVSPSRILAICRDSEDNVLL